MNLKPDRNSTPRIVPQLSGRKSIYKASPLHQYSPIQCISNSNMSSTKKTSQKKLNAYQFSSDESHKNADQFSSDESCENNESTSDESIDNDDTPINISKGSVNDKTLPKNQGNKDTMTNRNIFNISNILYIIIGGIILYCLVYAFNPECECTDKKEVTIDCLKISFPHQDDTFWLAIQSGVSEIINFNKPSTIVLMYTSATSNITNKLLEEISRYASRILNCCPIEPILLSAKHLDTEETKNDYGILIDRYRASLDEKHIMIIKDIDKISGTVAQAFHSFCDEYAPLVSRALFLFTVEVDELHADALKQVVDILRTKWSDVDGDILEPLITRISNMVLQIK